MKEIHLPCGKVALVSDEDHYRVSKLSWSDRGGGYVRARFKKKAGGDGRIVYLHRFILYAPAGFDVDHIDRNPLNNTRENLRIVTRSRNLMRGSVTLDRGKWRARMRVDGKQVSLGLYGSEAGAQQAVETALKKVWNGEQLKSAPPGPAPKQFSVRRDRGKWRVQQRISGKRVSRGIYTDKDEAWRAAGITPTGALDSRSSPVPRKATMLD